MRVGECLEAEGRAHAALSVVNAIGTGLGGAVGLSLGMECSLHLCRASEGERRARVVAGPLTSRVLGRPFKVSGRVAGAVERVISVVLEVLDMGGVFLARVDWFSEFPAEAGLKSSSALLTCLARGLSNALDAGLGPVEVARLVALVSREMGLSITGAFDDALATLGMGVVVTDNHSLELLKRFSPGGLDAVVAHGGVGRPIEGVDPGEYRRHAPLYRAAHRLALAGRWLEAMMLNGVLTSIITGEGGELIERALEHGEVKAAGITGKGPGFFAVGKGLEGLEEDLRSLGMWVTRTVLV